MSVYSSQPKDKEQLAKQLALLGDVLEEHLETAENFETVDKDALVHARANLKTGFLWFRQALKNDHAF